MTLGLLIDFQFYEEEQPCDLILCAVAQLCALSSDSLESGALRSLKSTSEVLFMRTRILPYRPVQTKDSQPNELQLHETSNLLQQSIGGLTLLWGFNISLRSSDRCDCMQ